MNLKVLYGLKHLVKKRRIVIVEKGERDTK